jgi:hypothetical protein
MLVDPDKRSIGDHVFGVGITSDRLAHFIEHAFQSPSSETPPGRVPVAERCRADLSTVAPCEPQYRFDNPIIIAGAHAGINWLPRQQTLDPRPLIISQNVANQG